MRLTFVESVNYVKQIPLSNVVRLMQSVEDLNRTVLVRGDFGAFPLSWNISVLLMGLTPSAFPVLRLSGLDWNYATALLSLQLADGRSGDCSAPIIT